MIELSAAEIAEITSGRLSGLDDPQAVIVSAAETDSRAMEPGSLFIAKPGEITDGHLFIDAALAAGASLVLAERETADPAGRPHPAVIVDDVVEAMGRLAAQVVSRIRAHSPTTVIGITGSAGKTTTKDLLRAVLEKEGPTVAPKGSYNGEVGVPLTVFTASLDTRYLVVEMGADAPGNIRYLAQMVRPDVGVVLMVGSAHAGKFGGADRIAEVKQELVEEVGAQGVVVLNDDDPQVRRMADVASAPVTWFSADSMDAVEGAVTAKEVRLDDDGHVRFTLFLGQEMHELTSGLTGTHHVTNLLAAVAAARAVGVAGERIVERLDGLGPGSRWRMERTERPDGVTVINDAYNANPESMREALRTLAMVTRPSGRRSVAVLGAMLELGDESIIRHAQLGETVVRLNIDRLLVVGDAAYPLYRGAVAEGSWGSEVHWVATAEEAEAHLDQELVSGDVVLFKSSNGAGLRLLGDRIAAKGSDDVDGGKAGASW
ncbi:UDP-N-acetylmuramoyl-tripeptide--D-alanyl-D-alanine ligase [Nesterenkonia xinjiangensis]|uniref:UDP-N-acetylmuramoyl-tripeptide--D-alanyl-D-alanine ligase n=1 Tax=Nesterenkonia xinjiangensis TaxID=225327 RepID=A0A7Z0K9Y7_9MICC|nr:UDP-N-acetylmuramoyl-tripeptide--D-alanyl-D-alanine ligase [Nesterenkonia xinjiangensis]NYJ79251.1 UDP-N-acetylmuramoyl-tripeptide--D-alanyl-D-alanine ligase [Nesterenkonia xinjiangensis]